MKHVGGVTWFYCFATIHSRSYLYMYMLDTIVSQFVRSCACDVKFVHYSQLTVFCVMLAEFLITASVMRLLELYRTNMLLDYGCAIKLKVS